MSKLFLTDYASYNEGKQFQFGHWVDLTDFSDSSDFLDYIKNHFLECDKKSPLDSPREEIMFTDYEDLPRRLYSESLSVEDLDTLFMYINLEDYQKVSFEYLVNDLGYNANDINISDIEEYSGLEDYDGIEYDMFEEYYPNIRSSNPYILIDYEQFMSETFNDFTASNGTTYYFYQ
jgi:hypothetical protein